jgi:hypothetical protein
METSAFSTLNSCIDIIFLLDMIIAFRTAFIDDYGNEVSTPMAIAKSYLKGSFWLDLFATLPLD